MTNNTSGNIPVFISLPDMQLIAHETRGSLLAEYYVCSTVTRSNTGQSAHPTARGVQCLGLHVSTSSPRYCKIRRSSLLSHWLVFGSQCSECFILLSRIRVRLAWAKIHLEACRDTDPRASFLIRLFKSETHNCTETCKIMYLYLCSWELHPEQNEFWGFPTKLCSPGWDK